MLWTYERMDTRNRDLCTMNYSHSSAFKPPVKYMEKLIRKMVHTYRCSRTQYEISSSTGGEWGPQTSKYFVKDKNFGMKFTCDLRKKECSCNKMHWTHHPCIHIVAVLHERKEFTRIWDFVGDIYRIESVEKTTLKMSDDNKKIWSDIMNMNEVVRDHEVVTEVYRNQRGNVIKNKRRHRSRGETNETEDSVVCLRGNIFQMHYHINFVKT